MFRHYRTLLGVLAASVLLALPAAAASSAIPGTVNYVEGQVAVAGQTVTPQSVGSVQLEPNQVLETGQGRAEATADSWRFSPGWRQQRGTPGIAGLGRHARLKCCVAMRSSKSAELFKDNNLGSLMNGASTRLEKEGLYAFNADSRQVQVFDGEAQFSKMTGISNVKKGHLIDLTDQPERTLEGCAFDPKLQAAQDPLYAWSNLRSEYVAEASMQSGAECFRGRWLYTGMDLVGIGIHTGTCTDSSRAMASGTARLDGRFTRPGWLDFMAVWIRLPRLSPRLCRTQVRGSRRGMDM